MPLLRKRRSDLQALIGATARERNIDQTFIEKDFWVIEVLRAATTPIDVLAKDGSRYPVRTIFKGGTSLSRAYELIERFSEDVDLLVSFPDVDSSTNARDKVLKSIRDNVAEHLALDSTRVVAGAATTGVKRNVRYLYPRFRYQGSSAISEGVLLEMGCRGGTYPTQQHALRSMVAEHAIDVLGENPAAWDEFAPVSVSVLAPERTLLEKLALLHDGASRSPDDGADETLRRAGRHLYDIYQLLQSDDVLAALNALGPSGVGELCNDIDEHSDSAGFSFTPRPHTGYCISPLLDADSPCHTALSEGYRSAMGLVYGAQPSYDECLATIRVHASLL
jgi:hypothetical protein